MAFSGMDGGMNQHLVSATVPIDGEFKRCGASNGATGDSKGEMRYDKHQSTSATVPTAHNNVCRASCAEGFTAHETSQTVQDFTCLRSDSSGWSTKKYKGSLTCTKVKCMDDALEAVSCRGDRWGPSGPATVKACNSPKSGPGENGNHINYTAWASCKTVGGMINTFQEQCHVECATGFTDSQKTTDTGQLAPFKYQCMAVADGYIDFGHGRGDQKFKQYGVWTLAGQKPVST